MDIQINVLAVVLAAVSSMVVGSIWYAQSVMGKTWAKLAKVKMDGKVEPKQMAWLMGSTFVASLVTAYALAYVTFLASTFFADSFLSNALQTGFWLWIGFTAARIYVHDAFEGRRKKLTLLNAAHELVTIEVMALVIGLLKP